MIGPLRRIPPLKLKLWAAIFCFLAAFWPAPGVWGVSNGELKEHFTDIKMRFETQVIKNSDPLVISCLALETTALAWTLAAAHLTEDSGTAAEWRERAADFERSWDESKNWDERHLAALDLYYDALMEVASHLVAKNRQIPLSVELKHIQKKTRKEILGLDGKPDAAFETRVVLSGSLASVVGVAVRSLGGGTMRQPVRRILEDMVARSEAVNHRPDIHYRAKLSFLYSGNLSGLTAMIFLLGQSAGPPLSQEIAVLHGALNKYGPGSSLPSALSLTAVAQAQASLPLAFWLATQ